MGNTESYTFLPKSGVLYQGGVERDGEIVGTGAKALSRFNRISHSPNYFGAISKESQDYVNAALKNDGKAIYKAEWLHPDLKNLIIAKEKVRHYEAISKGEGQFDASISTQLTLEKQKVAKYEAVVNGNNTDQLTIVQFVNDIVGKLEQPSYVAAAFKNIPLDKLRGKIPEMGYPPVNVQVNRLSEPKLDYSEFGQAEFRIYRNDVHVYIPREDRMEAVIDPMAVTIQQGNVQMMRARELLALKACSSLQLNGTYGTIPDITLTPSGSSAPRSTNDGPAAFVNVVVSHFNTYYNYLKYFIWNPLDYRAYLSNWFTYAFSQIQVPEGFGVIPFYGLEKYGCVAIVSPYVPRTFVYALAAEGAYELDGPYIVDAEYDAKKFADYNVVHDFIGYEIMNPPRFGEKLELTLSGVTPGTEITTNAQISKLLKAPANLVVKNNNSP